MRRDESVIDAETERAVAGWTKLADEMQGRKGGERQPSCVRCGSMFRVLDRGEAALCARCYLEGGSEAAH